MRKRIQILGLAIALLLAASLPVAASAQTLIDSPSGAGATLSQPQLDSEGNSIFQISTINALMEGDYDGDMTFGDLKQHGDFGIGTFNTLDGEMVALDGTVYQIKSDGAVYPVDDANTTPFAAVTFFQPEETISLDKAISWADLSREIDALLPTKNISYAVKIHGEFSYLKARSVPSQQKPYPKLTEVVNSQPTFEFQNVKGTLVGFRLPGYMEGVNVPGYHLHFITEDKSAGGHVLEAQLQNGSIALDRISSFQMVLPTDETFFGLDLSGDKSKDLEKVEK